jgi:hypothetical protein
MEEKTKTRFRNLEEKKIRELEAICDDLGVDSADFENKTEFVNAIKARLEEKSK